MDDEEVSIIEPIVPHKDLCAQNGDNVAVKEDACASSVLESSAQRYSGENKKNPDRRENKRNKRAIIRQGRPLVGGKIGPYEF